MGAENDGQAVLGVKIDPTQASAGRAQVEKDFEAVSRKGEDMQRRVSRSNKGFADSTLNAFERSSMAMSKWSLGTLSALRNLSPFHGQTLRMAEGLERATARLQRMTVQASQSYRGQQVLTRAYQEGTIAMASHEGAMRKLSAAKNEAIAAENALSAATTRSATAQRAAQSLTQTIALQRTNIQTGKNLLDQDKAALNAASSLEQYEKAQQNVQQRTVQLAAAESNLLGMRRQQVDVNSKAHAEAEALAQAKARMTAANRDLSNSEQIVKDSTAAAGSGFASMGTVVVGVIAILIGLAAAIYAIQKAWKFMIDSVKQSAHEQTETFGLEQLIRNATRAKAIIGELSTFRETAGIFKEKDIFGSAQQLLVMGTGLSNLTKRIEQFGQIAAATNGGTIASITGVYNRVVTAVSGTMGIQSRQLQQFTSEGMNLSKMLADSEGVSQERIQEMFAKRLITMEMINRAIEKATGANGIYANMVENRAKTMDGALAVLGTRWEMIQEAFGAPIRDALTPLINSFSMKMKEAVPVAEEMGRRVAGIAQEFGKLAREEGWRNALKAAWAVLMDEIGELIENALKEAFSMKNMPKGFDIGPRSFANVYADEVKAGETKFSAALTAAWAFAQSEVTGKVITAGQEGADQYTEGATDKLAQNKAKLQAAIDALFGGDSFNKTPFSLSNLPVQKQEAPSPFGEGDNFLKQFQKGESDWEKYKTDLQLINDYWEEYAQIQGKASTATERERRIMELTMKTANELNDPTQFNPYLDKIGEVIIKEAERAKAAEAADQRIKLGIASTTEAWNRGLQKFAESVGNVAQQTAKLAEDIANAIGNNIASGLTDLVTGAKDAATAFRDMAASMLRDIAALIIKMLVLRAVKAIAGFNDGGSVSSGASSLGSFAGFAIGGHVSGGSGIVDDVPAMLTSGEYVLTRDDVSKLGGSQKIDAWRKGYEGGGLVTSSQTYYGRRPHSLPHNDFDFVPPIITDPTPTIPPAQYYDRYSFSNGEWSVQHPDGTWDTSVPPPNGWDVNGHEIGAQPSTPNPTPPFYDWEDNVGGTDYAPWATDPTAGAVPPWVMHEVELRNQDHDFGWNTNPVDSFYDSTWSMSPGDFDIGNFGGSPIDWGGSLPASPWFGPSPTWDDSSTWSMSPGDADIGGFGGGAPNWGGGLPTYTPPVEAIFNQDQWDTGMWGYDAAGNWTNWGADGSMSVGGTNIPDFGGSTSLGSDLDSGWDLGYGTRPTESTTTSSGSGSGSGGDGTSSTHAAAPAMPTWAAAGYGSLSDYTSAMSIGGFASATDYYRHLQTNFTTNMAINQTPVMSTSNFVATTDEGHMPGTGAINYGTSLLSAPNNYWSGSQILFGGLDPASQFAFTHMATGGLIPSFKEGGTMPWDGLAYLHEGENVTPRGGSSSTTIKNDVTLHIENHGDGRQTRSLIGGSDEESRDLLIFLEARMNEWAERNKDYGGKLYSPRNR